MTTSQQADLEARIAAWYAASARVLPWRQPDAGAWSVLVSEVMLQQTPVTRVLPAHRAWLERWPTPSALAVATPADAVRQWDRLGYPRRAIRLHATATIITERHGGEVPASASALRALPGVGAYTAAAVASFAFGQRQVVLDTNVRRVLARLITGQERPARSVSVAETALAESLLPPAEDHRAARWSVGLMELGALVCTSARPRCDVCPVATRCSWLQRGRPRDAARPPAKPYEGSDRQCRGALLAELRRADGPLPARSLDACWPNPDQRERVLAMLISDGLAVRHGRSGIGLPGERPGRR